MNLDSEAKRQKLDFLNLRLIALAMFAKLASTLPRVSTDYHAAALLAVQHFHERELRNLAYRGESNLPHENRHCQAFIGAAEARAHNAL